ncbi:hypothetical protein SCLCIDRAFT_21302 [Scleroderma citrinum Foug A]|uniref:Uncharacterized protein n=1 Tax=Scleroderma citrinum Foug A TaxID=1036808 RepID=A0A0C3AR48_9AGAM|nr:hypothetical protein SCLCIDRAFT_21302 [Scleroderma citrinum Foug A]
MSGNYSRVMSGQEGNEVPSKHDWMKANLEELDLVNENSKTTVTKKAQEHHRRKHVRQLEVERLAWEAAEAAERHCWEEDAVCAALERCKAKMQEVAKAMRQGGAWERFGVPGEWLGADAAPPTMWAVYSAGYHLHSATRCQESEVPGVSEVEDEVPPREGGDDDVAVPAITKWKGKKQKHMKRVMADAASIEEVEAALGGADDWGAIATAVIRVGHQGVGPMLGQLSQALKHFERLTGVTATNYLRMTGLLNWLGEPELVRDKGKARAVEDKNESDQKDEDEDETGK